ncbi:pq loop repeat protein [Pseudozyma hubeiensis SY62]|uniref:Pq loop repeat protein n=1 Tax=Pseudozyma hubeiensis (strain SY62) TaxID=1305764 RepID=R9P0H3_PSEHS|nr:pq loop repeat protein [Pseudozyma hubeiensis SY62]GAC94641.1 pq loop repeat protein [Pseudozyma hubeiensis SY62]
MGVISHTLIARSAVVLSDHPSRILTNLSHLLGWIYTVSWSLSFYPQVIHNYTHRSTIGLSTDFVFLNAVGHTSYFVYNFLLFYYEPVRRAYRHAHGGRDSVVQLNDFIFSLHATILALFTLAQYLWYRKPNQHLSRTVSLSLALVLTLTVFALGARRLKLVSWLNIVDFASSIKLFITLTKYLPQIKLNKDRKSTKGFAIENILLDLTGGVLSLAQLFIDSVWIQGSWQGVTGDWGKLALGALSIAFDAVLCWQHYVLYGDKEPEREVQREAVEVEDDEEEGEQDAGYGAAESGSSRSNRAGDTESSALLR